MTLCSVSSADVESQSVRKVTLGGVPVLVGKLGQIPLKFPYNTKILWFYSSKLKKKTLLLSNCKTIFLLKVIIQEKKTNKIVNILVNLVPHISHHKGNS